MSAASANIPPTPRAVAQREPPDWNGEAATHHSTSCPNCSAQLYSSRCKMLCRTCGFYLSCADFY